jgi:hypothetical protein
MISKFCYILANDNNLNCMTTDFFQQQRASRSEVLHLMVTLGLLLVLYLQLERLMSEVLNRSEFIAFIIVHGLVIVLTLINGLKTLYGKVLGVLALLGFSVYLLLALYSLILFLGYDYQI